MAYLYRAFGWFWFFSGKEGSLKKTKCGKWMCFFTDQAFAIQICQKAIDEGVCAECKCTDLEGKPSGVVCFYLNGDDLEGHKRVLGFMKENRLIPKTKAGKLYNISFKFDQQTKAGEYGAAFKGAIRLEQFVNLQTGEFWETPKPFQTECPPFL